MILITTPQWNYIEHETLVAELYDWTIDPEQLHNLIDPPESNQLKKHPITPCIKLSRGSNQI